MSERPLAAKGPHGGSMTESTIWVCYFVEHLNCMFFRSQYSLPCLLLRPAKTIPDSFLHVPTHFPFSHTTQTNSIHVHLAVSVQLSIFHHLSKLYFTVKLPFLTEDSHVNFYYIIRNFTLYWLNII